jgi:hypothetical protein
VWVVGQVRAIEQIGQGQAQVGLVAALWCTASVPFDLAIPSLARYSRFAAGPFRSRARSRCKLGMARLPPGRLCLLALRSEVPGHSA